MTPDLSSADSERCKMCAKVKGQHTAFLAGIEVFDKIIYAGKGFKYLTQNAKISVKTMYCIT